MKTVVACITLAIAVCLGAAPAGSDLKSVDEESIEIEALGVSFLPITGWHLAGQQALERNLDRYEFSENELDRILSTHRGSRTIASFIRSDPRTTAGIIPTVNVIANPSRDTSEVGIRSAANAAIVALRQATEDLTLVEDITAVTISDTLAYRFIVEFALNTRSGSKVTIRNQTYVLPRKNVLLQISMSESIPSEEGRTFAAFIDSIKVNE